MKQASRIALGTLGLLLFSCSAALAYWTAAPELVGPKAEMVQFCSLLKPGMPSTALDAALQQNPAVQTTPIHAGSQYPSQAKAGWFCTCGVQIENDRIRAVENVLCVD